MRNKNRPISIVDKAHGLARQSKQPPFEEVLVLKPPESLFPWTKVSHLPINVLQKSIQSLEGLGWRRFWTEEKLTPRINKDNLLIAFRRPLHAIQEHKKQDNRVHPRS